jgi:hypothetical protein
VGRPPVADRLNLEVLARERLTAAVPLGGRRPVDAGLVALAAHDEQVLLAAGGPERGRRRRRTEIHTVGKRPLYFDPEQVRPGGVHPREVARRVVEREVAGDDDVVRRQGPSVGLDLAGGPGLKVQRPRLLEHVAAPVVDGLGDRQEVLPGVNCAWSSNRSAPATSKGASGDSVTVAGRPTRWAAAASSRRSSTSSSDSA